MRSTAAEDGRSAAVSQLVRIEEHGAYTGRISLPPELDARERRFVTELVAGVTRWRRWLDYVIEKSSGRAVKDLEPVLRQILRVGAFEILQLHTPEYAAVNEAVELAKRMVRRGAGGLVNAVLRKVAASKDQSIEPEGPPATALAIRHSHPDWMVRAWIDQLGKTEARTLLEWNNRRPHYAIRVNPMRSTVDGVLRCLEDGGIEANVSPYLDDFIRVDGLQPVLESGLVDSGAVVVQDEAAGLVVRVLDPQPGETIADCCAAPGGKLFYAAARMRSTGRLVAIESNESRLSLTQRTSETLGQQSVEFVHGDATQLGKLLPGHRFDRILVDAPCTGLGVLAKRPDLRWRRRPSDIPELTVLQDRLLDSAAEAVDPGGLVVYSTCTIEPAENDDRIADFIQRHPDFHVESVAPYVDHRFVTGSGFYASFPQRHGIDGAFAARLRKSQ